MFYCWLIEVTRENRQIPYSKAFKIIICGSKKGGKGRRWIQIDNGLSYILYSSTVFLIVLNYGRSSGQSHVKKG